MTATDYDGYRDVIANWFDAAGFHQPYNAADRFVGDLRKGGFMVFPLNENWKRLDELEAERDRFIEHLNEYARACPVHVAERDLLRGLLRKMAVAGRVALAGDVEGPYLAGPGWGCEVTAAEAALFKKATS